MNIVGEPLKATRLPNGAGAAAVFSAGLGVFTLSVLAIIGDHSASFRKLMIFYTPTGPLSGVTDTAVAVGSCPGSVSTCCGEKATPKIGR
jgi:hypothetical protein